MQYKNALDSPFAIDSLEKLKNSKKLKKKFLVDFQYDFCSTCTEKTLHYCLRLSIRLSRVAEKKYYLHDCVPISTVPKL